MRRQRDDDDDRHDPRRQHGDPSDATRPHQGATEACLTIGEGIRDRAAGVPVSLCLSCTSCCDLPRIEALDKPAYKPCRHIGGAGCTIHGLPERPGACADYACAWLSARLAGHPDRNRIPHPLDAGAYLHIDEREGVAIVFIDPKRPEAWKATTLVDHFRALVASGFALFITDRGRQLVIRDRADFDLMVNRDLVALAEAEGRPLDIGSHADSNR